MLRRIIKKDRSTRHGDTMIEVLFAITAYSVVAIFTIITMNMGLQQGEAALELSQTRIEIAAQADGLRFIHNAFLSEREYGLTGSDSYKALWQRITSLAVDSSTSIKELSVGQCKNWYSGDYLASRNAFILNLRNLSPTGGDLAVLRATYGSSYFREASLYPRVVYTTNVSPWDGSSDSSDADYYDESGRLWIGAAEGIWIIARKSAATSNMLADKPEYYDFHIYSCWYSPGADHPSTIGTIIRLYNPELQEAIR